jgi:hypothetical protein
VSRRRQPNVDGGRTGRHNVKTSPEQEAAILMGAQRLGITPAAFMAEAAVAVAQAEADAPETPTARRRQVQQLFALQASIAEVAWQARKVGVNVNQLVKAVHQGAALPSEEMRAFLAAERDHLARARELYERVGSLIDERAAQGLGA